MCRIGPVLTSNASGGSATEPGALPLRRHSFRSDRLASTEGIGRTPKTVSLMVVPISPGHNSSTAPARLLHSFPVARTAERGNAFHLLIAVGHRTGRRSVGSYARARPAAHVDSRPQC